MPFQEGIERTPVTTPPFPCHTGTGPPPEPVGQRQQVGGHRAAGPDVLHGFRPLGTRDEACRDGLCVDVEATAPGIDYVHHTPTATIGYSTEAFSDRLLDYRDKLKGLQTHPN